MEITLNCIIPELSTKEENSLIYESCMINVTNQITSVNFNGSDKNIYRLMRRLENDASDSNGSIPQLQYWAWRRVLESLGYTFEVDEE